MVFAEWAASNSICDMRWNLQKRTPHTKSGRYSRTGIALLVASALGFGLSQAPIAAASRNGEVQKANPFAIGFTFQMSGHEYVCSGTLISPTVVMTAGHCVVDTNGSLATNIEVTPPGIALDAPIDPSNPLPAVKKIVTFPGFKPTGMNEVDDVAYLILGKPIAATSFISVATADQVKSLTDSTPMNGYGFGVVYETGAGFSTLVRKYELTWAGHAIDENNPKMLRIESPNAIGCTGDSGGPITAKLNDGSEVVVGVLSGVLYSNGGACGSKGPSGNYAEHITFAYEYLDLISPYLAEEKAAAAAAKAAAAVKAAAATSKPKSITITCAKGKLTKKVSGAAPKCPAGFKKK